VIPETIMKLHEVVAGLEADPDIQVVIFTSELPDFFINHFDGSTAGDLPTPNTRAPTRSGPTSSCG
jgi:enoyl-CoA hydratase/carnithine racemase